MMMMTMARTLLASITGELGVILTPEVNILKEKLNAYNESSLFFCIFYFFFSKLFPPPDADHRGAEDDQEGGDLGLARPSHAPQAHGVVTRVRGAELPDGDRDKVGGEVHGEPLLR